MGETRRAGGSLEGTGIPGVRRKQEEKGPSRRALSAWEEAAEGGRVLTWGHCGEGGLEREGAVDGEQRGLLPIYPVEKHN